ncbi:glycosyltransferase family 2 protein [Candidatus Roizmanbacteria bacterium]|jgi:hypothetical protein|nr:glycosyltransferase family 2 protein [Candidatus Roizmanbacteria bacterium]
MKKISIVIVSYNTEDVTLDCLRHLKKNFERFPSDYEIIVVDNASSDQTVLSIKKEMEKWPELKLIKNEANVGYGRANNQALDISQGEYILYLNSDVIVDGLNFEDILSLMDSHQQIGALTIKVVLPSGQVDPASHRGFPTVWRSFCYFFQLERLFGKVPGLGRIFGGYHLTTRSLDTIHEIDSPTGAFYLTRSSILKKTGAFDRDYFMYGEDLDLSFKIKSLGYKIIYYPLAEVLHLKYVSGLKNRNVKVRSKTRSHFYEAMKIFYRKHYSSKYPEFFNRLIYFFIDIKSKISK